MPSPTKPGPVDHIAAPEAPPSSPSINNFFLRIIAKKDSTETMLKSLVSRTHVTKPVAYFLRHNDKNSECFLQYQSKEIAQEVQSKISGEKINGAVFDTEVIEVEAQPDDHLDNEEDSENSTKEPSPEHLSTAPNLSSEAIRSITDMLKQKPKRKTVTLNISPRNKQTRHQKMKSGSKLKRKSKKCSTSSESDSSPDVNLDDNLLKRVKNILAQEPIAAGSTSNSKNKPFDPYSGMPSKPSKVLKDKAKNLLKTVQISSSDEEQNPSSDKIAALLNIVLKNQKKHQKKKKKKKRS